MAFYLLDENKKPYQVSLEENLAVYDNLNMKITAQDKIKEILVSTVFLSIDHSRPFDENGDRIVDPTPVLWETMIFGGKQDMYQKRYTSHKDALAGHQHALLLVQPKD